MTITSNTDKAIADIHSCENKLTSSMAILHLLKSRYYTDRAVESDDDYSLGKSICIALDFVSEALAHVADVGDYVSRQ